MPGGGYRYYRDAELGPEYDAAMDALFDTYARRCRACARGSTRRTRAPTASREAARARAVNAKALDLLRGLLPAASLSHMGIYATGQSYEQLILHLIGHPLPEARRYGELILRARSRRSCRASSRASSAPTAAAPGPATSRSAARPASAGRARLGPRGADPADARPSVTLTHVDGDEEQLLAALLFEAAGASEQRTRAAVAALDARRARRAARATWSASAATAATAPAAASRRCATASRSSPTTARSATSSATAC